MKTMISMSHEGNSSPAIVFWLVVLPATACVLISCAGIDTNTTPYGAAQHFAPVDPATVEILRAEPTKAHEHLGEIVMESSTSPAPPVTEVEKKLRTEAAKMGADAVMVVVDYVLPARPHVTGVWRNQNVVTVQGYKIVGVAIKYRD